MFFVSPKSFCQSDMVIWYAMIAISGLLEVHMMSGMFEFLTMSDLFEFLIYTEEVWAQLWIFLKKYERIDKYISC